MTTSVQVQDASRLPPETRNCVAGFKVPGCRHKRPAMSASAARVARAARNSVLIPLRKNRRKKTRDAGGTGTRKRVTA